jgi:hypothetical protein
MAKLPQLSDFEGEWRISRTIDDRRTSLTGALEGTARLQPGGYEGGMIYREEGQLDYGDGNSMEATRIYLWQDHDKGISVHFQDGGDFHVIELDRFMPDAQHYCDPDMYHVSYNFTNWPKTWSSVWRVQGPKKDYRMETIFKRR